MKELMMRVKTQSFIHLFVQNKIIWWLFWAAAAETRCIKHFLCPLGTGEISVNKNGQ
jgi:hypothetical protein